MLVENDDELTHHLLISFLSQSMISFVSWLEDNKLLACHCVLQLMIHGEDDDKPHTMTSWGLVVIFCCKKHNNKMWVYCHLILQKMTMSFNPLLSSYVLSITCKWWWWAKGSLLSVLFFQYLQKTTLNPCLSSSFFVLFMCI